MRSRLTRRSGSTAPQHESLVGVIIPAYNSAMFLGETLDSLSRQTFPDWTCVVVDDGSTDDTASIVGSAIQADGRFSYRVQPNSGSAAARNAGFAALRSRYVQFLDADDLIAPEKFERQVSLMEADPGLGVSYSSYRLLDSATGELTGRRFAEMRPGTESLEDFLYQWERGLTIPINAGLFRSDLWPTGEVFDSTLRTREDWVMWVELALRGTTMKLIDEELAIYRVHRESKTTDNLGMALGFARAARAILANLPVSERAEYATYTTAYLSNTVAREFEAAAAIDPSPDRKQGPGSNAVPVQRRRGRTAWLQARPNPIAVEDGTGLGQTALHWRSSSPSLEIHVDAPDGPLLLQGRGSGSVETGKWVRDGTRFFLQDTEAGLPLSSKYTLASITVGVRRDRPSPSTTSRPGS